MVPAKLQVVGEDEVLQGSEVAVQLLGPLRLVQGPSDVLRLDVPDGEAAPLDDVVRRSTLDPFGLVDGDDVGGKGLHEGLQRPPVSVLRRNAGPKLPLNLCQVGF